MRQTIKITLIFLYLCLWNSISSAGPWFTGPILAPAGHTIPKGHTNFELYGIDIFTNGEFDQSGQVQSRPLFRTFVGNPIITHGFTDWLDVQLALPYLFNSHLGEKSNRLADVNAGIGLQLIEQQGSPKRVDTRIIVQETIPTGRYDHLNPDLAGTDATGLGSYQTQVGLDFQYLLEVFDTHYLRTRLILSHVYSSSVEVNGLSSYGGTINTRGTISPASENNIDLAFEFTLTQNWVAVMEGYIAKGQGSQFNGILNVGNIGGPDATIGSGDYTERGLAPAIEYNFNEHIGLIGGVWFPVSGVNTSHYTSYVLALNAYW